MRHTVYAHAFMLAAGDVVIDHDGDLHITKVERRDGKRFVSYKLNGKGRTKRDTLLDMDVVTKRVSV